MKCGETLTDFYKKNNNMHTTAIQISQQILNQPHLLQQCLYRHFAEHKLDLIQRFQHPQMNDLVNNYMGMRRLNLETKTL